MATFPFQAVCGLKTELITPKSLLSIHVEFFPLPGVSELRPGAWLQPASDSVIGQQLLPTVVLSLVTQSL